MTKQFNFEAAMTELEAITEWFERPDIELDQSLAKFERGLQLAQELKDHLQAIENKVQTIKLRFDKPIRNEADASDTPGSIDQTDLFK